MRKSEVIYDLCEISKRLRCIRECKSTANLKEDIESIIGKLDEIKDSLSLCATFSITARKKNDDTKCRFCGK